MKLLLLLSVYSPPTRRGFTYTYESLAMQFYKEETPASDFGSSSLQKLLTSKS